MKKIFTTLILVFTSISGISVLAQESQTNSKIESSLSVDFVSRYVWRGVTLSSTPAIQPTLDFTMGKLSIGSWASYTTSQSEFNEVDLYAGYQLGAFKLSLYDYFAAAENATVNYFDYSKNTTSHTFEAILEMEATDAIPLNATLGTFFYGNDKDSTGTNYYSTYFELAYPFKLQENELSVFCGVTPFEGYYANKFNVVNAGISISRTIPVTEKFSLPLSGTLGVNPYLKTIYFVVGLSL